MKRNFLTLKYGLGCLSVAGVILCASVPQAFAEDAPDIRRDATVKAVEKVMPSVVNIATETLVQVQDQFEDFFNPFFAPYYRRAPQAQRSLGSGVIIDEEGYILTNDHVVRRAEKIWVKIHGHDKPYSAKLVATNPNSDISLIKLECKEDEHFTAVQFAHEDDLLLGETVLALGNPFGLGGSVSRGILSSKSRTAPRENEKLDIPNWLQTDASINPGNSGGPLVNLKGELIGLNVAILSQAQGIGFAIPIKLVDDALADIISPEQTSKGLWFGARLRASPLPLTVLSIEPGSPAEQAGLKNGDIVLSINQHAPKGLIDFTEQLLGLKKTDAVLKVKSGAETHEVTVHLVLEKSKFNADLIEKMTGVRLQELTPRLAAYFGVEQGSGFVIASVVDNSPAAQYLQAGMLVTGIDGRVPQNLVEAARILYTKKKGDKVRLDLLIQRQQGAFIMKNASAVELPIQPVNTAR